MYVHTHRTKIINFFWVCLLSSTTCNKTVFCFIKTMKNRIIMNIIPEIVFNINYNIFAVNRSIFGSLVKKNHCRNLWGTFFKKWKTAIYNNLLYHIVTGWRHYPSFRYLTHVLFISLLMSSQQVFITIQWLVHKTVFVQITPYYTLCMVSWVVGDSWISPRSP